MECQWHGEENPGKLGLTVCLGCYGQWTVADMDSCLIELCCQPVDNNGNYVNLWDKLICLLNFASRFIYIVLKMLACSFMVFGS